MIFQFCKNNKLYKLILPLSITAIFAVLAMSGCSTQQDGQGNVTDGAGKTEAVQTAGPSETGQTSTTDSEEALQKALADFESLVENDPSPKQMIEFLSGSIMLVKPEDASEMILELEKLQKKSIHSLEDKFYNETIQQKLNNIWVEGFDINEALKTEDVKLKALLQETVDGGYRVEAVEGTCFPILNYGMYVRFSQFATSDIRDYIGIMAAESGKVPAKDAALVIGWDEVIDRALNQEKFLADHPDSKKLEEVRQLYSRYLSFAFCGLDNTPAFIKESMVPDLKEAYRKLLTSSTDQGSGQKLKGFAELLEKNGYKLTKEVDDYRKAAVDVPLGC